MAKDLRYLQGRLTRMSRQFLSRARQLEVDVARQTHKLLVNGTPVDKGVARSNWLISIGFEIDAVIPARVPGRHLGIDETANAQATIEAGLGVLMSALTPGNEGQIFIQNNVPYIDKLNEGYSGQAPSGFVESAIKEGLDIALSRARKLTE